MSGNSGSSTSQQTEMANDLYGDIQKTAESMLTPGVGRVTMNQTSGVVVVTDVPEVVRSIGDYLRDENTKLSKQVLLKVVVYTVHTDISDKLGIDWDIVFKSLSGKYGINLANAFNAGADVVHGGFEILQTATGRAWTSSPPSGFTSRYAERARLPHTLHTQAIHALSVHTLIAALPRPERRGLRSMLLDHNLPVRNFYCRRCLSKSRSRM